MSLRLTLWTLLAEIRATSRAFRHTGTGGPRYHRDATVAGTAELPSKTDMGPPRGNPFIYAGFCAQDLKFAFDRVFDVDAKQTEVYQGTTQPLIDFVLDGYNATVFAYGVRRPGRTYNSRIGGLGGH